MKVKIHVEKHSSQGNTACATHPRMHVEHKIDTNVRMLAYATHPCADQKLSAQKNRKRQPLHTAKKATHFLIHGAPMNNTRASAESEVTFGNPT